MSVTDEWIQKRTKRENGEGKNAVEIFDILKDLLKESGVKVSENDWESYDNINKYIESQLR